MSPFIFTSFEMGRRDEVMLVGVEFISLRLILTALLHADLITFAISSGHDDIALIE